MGLCRISAWPFRWRGPSLRWREPPPAAPQSPALPADAGIPREEEIARWHGAHRGVFALFAALQQGGAHSSAAMVVPRDDNCVLAEGENEHVTSRYSQVSSTCSTP